MTNIFDFEFQIICRMIAAEFPVENLIKNRDLTQTFYALGSCNFVASNSEEPENNVNFHA